MHSFINDASIMLAQAGDGAPAGWQRGLANFFPLILVFAILYFMWIRPEQKRAKAHKEMVRNARAGDKVVTSGGIHGKVTSVTEQTVKIQIADKVEIEVERAAIGRVADKASGSEGK